MNLCCGRRHDGFDEFSAPNPVLHATRFTELSPSVIGSPIQTLAGTGRDAMTPCNRSVVLRAGAALAVAGAELLRTSRTRAQGNPLPDVQALLFDVFGTVVDWRNGVAREAEKVL